LTRSDSGLVGAAFIALLATVSAGPERLVDRLSGPLDKGLSQEGRALPSPMDPMFLTAPLGHRRNTSVLLQCCRAGITLALFTEGNQQSVRSLFDLVHLMRDTVKLPLLTTSSLYTNGML